MHADMPGQSWRWETVELKDRERIGLLLRMDKASTYRLDDVMEASWRKGEAVVWIRHWLLALSSALVAAMALAPWPPPPRRFSLRGAFLFVTLSAILLGILMAII